MPYLLRTYNLIKTYQGREVVSNVNMSVKKGEIYGFLGSNGAGKTTIMRMITNLVKPTSGEIQLFNEKITDQSYEYLKRIGTIIESPIFYEKHTAKENLELHCEYMGYYDKKAIDSALDLVNLRGIDRKQVKDFSLGMKQRLGIARAIITKPELLILDEPINGLDPIGIKEMRDLFMMFCKEYGCTILLSSHILGEIEQIADTIGVINKGKLMEEISMESIRESNKEYVELMTDNCNQAAFILSNNLSISNFKIVDNKAIRIYDTRISQGMISKELIENDVMIDSFTKKSNSLEDYFINLLNGGSINE